MKNNSAAKTLLFICLLLPFISLARVTIFPGETSCIILPFNGLQLTGNIYHNKNIPKATREAIGQAKTTGENRNQIYCPA